jgi:NADPH:quinone reductase-like Zn-dependent oxidoreductase
MLFDIPEVQYAQLLVRKQKWEQEQENSTIISNCFQFKADHPVCYNIGPTQVLVRLKACSLTASDCKIRRGFNHGILGVRVPTVLGTDGAGVIVKVGDTVDESLFDIGDKVLGRTSVVYSGTNCQYAVFDVSDLAHKPENIKWTEAACIPTAALLAWKGINTCGDPTEKLFGANVLILGMNESIGAWSVLLMRHYFKANVYVVCGEKYKNIAKDLGANYVIDYEKVDYNTYLRSLGERPMRMILDCIGNYENIEEHCSLLTREDGHYVSFLSSYLRTGFESYPEFKLSYLWKRLKSIVTWQEPNLHIVTCPSSGKELELLVEWIQDHEELYRKIPMCVYCLKDLDRAHEDFEKEISCFNIAIKIPYTIQKEISE